MDVLKYISVVLVLFLCDADAGGHGGSHHDHVKLHVPEFIHHDHHTKVITIHHHHHKPKEKHYHHHHHHHHKPHVPYEHHYHKHHKKSHTKTQTSTLGHDQGHTSHSGLQGYHGHRGNYGHRAHPIQGQQIQNQKHHDDTPSFSYDSNPVTFEDDYKTFAPSVSAPIPQTPQVYGVEHTVKQVKVFDSLPGALPSNTGAHGYEVTEEGEQSEDDAFTAINTLPQTYPATFGFVRNDGIDSAQNDVLANFPVHSSLQASHDPFASAPQPISFANIETFSTGHADPFSSLAPAQDIFPSISSSQFPLNEDETGFDGPANVYSGGITGTALGSADDTYNDDTPVSFSREAGIQESVNTGGVKTLVY